MPFAIILWSCHFVFLGSQHGCWLHVSKSIGWKEQKCSIAIHGWLHLDSAQLHFIFTTLISCGLKECSWVSGRGGRGILISHCPWAPSVSTLAIGNLPSQGITMETILISRKHFWLAWAIWYYHHPYWRIIEIPIDLSTAFGRGL